MAKLILLIGAVGVSFSAIFVRWSTAPAMIMACYRMALAAVIMLPVVLLRAKDELKTLRLRDATPCILSGVFLAVHFLVYYKSLEYTGITAAVTLVDTEVFFVSAGMFVLTREKVTLKAFLGIAAAFCGSVIIAMADYTGGGSVRGAAYALAGAFFMAVYTMIGRIKRQNLSTGVYTFIVYTAGAATLLLAAAVSDTDILGYAPANYAIAAGMAIVCTLFGHSIFSWGLGREKASYISVLRLMEPVFASVLGIFILGEFPRPVTVLGGVIVIAGVAWCSIQSERERAFPKRTENSKKSS